MTLPTAVRNLTCIASPGGRIRLDWLRPIDDGGALDRYVVHFGRLGGWDGFHDSPTGVSSGFVHKQTVDSAAVFAELVGSNIVVDQTYVVRMQAFTSAGPGPV